MSYFENDKQKHPTVLEAAGPRWPGQAAFSQTSGSLSRSKEMPTMDLRESVAWCWGNWGSDESWRKGERDFPEYA